MFQSYHPFALLRLITIVIQMVHIKFYCKHVNNNKVIKENVLEV